MATGRPRDARGRMVPRDADEGEIARRSAIKGRLSDTPKRVRKPRAKARRTVQWSVKLEAAFCAALVRTMNVRTAAAEIGVTEDSVHSRRQRSAGLRRLMGQAIREGYQQLELRLLERALKGVPTDYDAGKKTGTVVEFCDRTALALLARWRDVVRAEAVAEPVQTVTRAGLKATFATMRQRLQAEGANDDGAL